MYAIIRVGGRQYRVEENTTLLVNKLEGEAGAALTIDEVLAIGGENPVFGAPNAPGATVSATIVEQTKGPKIDGFTYKAKKNVRRHYGHRQDLTKIRIETIAVGK
jgi:large subunit ribosomal protein L21